MDYGIPIVAAMAGFGFNILLNAFTRPERDGDRRAGSCDRRQAACDAVHRTLAEQITNLRIEQGENKKMFTHISEQLSQGHRNFEHLGAKIEELSRVVIEMKVGE